MNSIDMRYCHFYLLFYYYMFLYSVRNMFFQYSLFYIHISQFHHAVSIFVVDFKHNMYVYYKYRNKTLKCHTVVFYLCAVNCRSLPQGQSNSLCVCVCARTPEHPKESTFVRSNNKQHTRHLELTLAEFIMYFM